MGLDTEREYQPVLDYLKERGHPLFNRVTAQVLDSAVVDANAQDMLNTYYTIKNQMDPSIGVNSYRVRGPLCKFCAYQHLCEYDMHGMTMAEREIIVDELVK
jgi:hypothetical protein